MEGSRNQPNQRSLPKKGKRSVDQISTSESQKKTPRGAKMPDLQMLPLFRDNFCACKDITCKEAMNIQFRDLFKKSLTSETIQ